MAKNQDDAPVIISEDDARGGVTGHHVRYVLAFGLAGIIIAFLAIGAYFGYGALTQVVSKIFAAEGMLRQRLISYAVSLATTRQRIKVWLAFSLRPQTMFHRPSRSSCNSSQFV